MEAQNERSVALASFSAFTPSYPFGRGFRAPARQQGDVASRATCASLVPGQGAPQGRGGPVKSRTAQAACWKGVQC